MARPRSITPDEVDTWLALLLEATFSGDIDTPQAARLGLLGIASVATQYPYDVPPARQVTLLLTWAEQWISPADWSRLAARVRKRRQRNGR